MNLKANTHLNKHKTTLKEASLDTTNNIPMTESETVVHNFDCITKDYFKSLDPDCKLPKSNDAILFDEIKFLFIEFKNGNINPGKVIELINKNKDSIKTLKTITDDHINDDYVKDNGSYILVYNIDNINYEIFKEQVSQQILQNNEIASSNAREFIFAQVSYLAKRKNTVLFGLGCMADVFAVIKTVEKKEFNTFADELTADYFI